MTGPGRSFRVDGETRKDSLVSCSDSAGVSGGALTFFAVVLPAVLREAGSRVLIDDGVRLRMARVDGAICEVLPLARLRVPEVDATGTGGATIAWGSSGFILKIEVCMDDLAVDFRTTLRLRTDARKEAAAETTEKASLSTLCTLVLESFKPVLVVGLGTAFADSSRSSTGCSSSARSALVTGCLRK